MRPARIGIGRFADLFANYPGYGLAERLMDVLSRRQRIRLIVTSGDYVELRLLWGLIEFTKGEKREFLIDGGPGLCDTVIRQLEESKTLRVVSHTLEGGERPKRRSDQNRRTK